MSNKLNKRRRWGITCHLRCFWGQRPSLISWKNLAVIIRILHSHPIFKRCKKKKNASFWKFPTQLIWMVCWETIFFYRSVKLCQAKKITLSSLIAFSFNCVCKNADVPTDVDQPSRLVASLPDHGMNFFCHNEISIFRDEFLGYSVSWRTVESWVYSDSSRHKTWKLLKIK